ncbi:MAG: ATP-binding protein [Candidatus Thorarchaeota archaeon]
MTLDNQVVSKWADELQNVIETVLCQSKSQSRILTVIESNLQLLDDLFDRLTMNSSLIEVKNDEVHLMSPECDHPTIVYYINGKESGSQGFAGVLRDEVGPKGISLLLLGSPEHLGIETIATTDLRVTSPGLGSRVDIIKKVIDRLQTRDESFEAIMEAITETKSFDRLIRSAMTNRDRFNGFNKIMRFLIKASEVDNVLDLADYLPIIELPPDDYSNVEEFEEGIIRELDEFSDLLRSRFAARGQIASLLSRYYIEEEIIAKAANWCSWFSGKSIVRFNELLERMPPSLYLSKRRPPSRSDEAEEIRPQKALLDSLIPLDSCFPETCEIISICDDEFLRIYGEDLEFAFEISNRSPKLKLGAKLAPIDPSYEKYDAPKKDKGTLHLSDYESSPSEVEMEGIYALSFAPFNFRARKPGNEITQPVVFGSRSRQWIAFPEGVEYDKAAGCFVFDLNRMKLLLSGPKIPKSLNIWFVKLYDDLEVALEADPHISGIKVSLDRIFVDLSEVKDREMGESWIGYIIIQDNETDESIFSIPVMIPRESSKYVVRMPELHLVTSLLGSPSKIPKFRTSAINNLDDEILSHLESILLEKEHISLDDFVGLVDVAENKIQAQFRLKGKPDFIEIEYNDILVSAERHFRENPSNPYPIALTSNLEIEQASINPEWSKEKCRELEILDKFLNVREKLFNALPKDRAFPIFDLLRVEDEIIQYVQLYKDLLTTSEVFSDVDLKVRAPVGMIQFFDCVFVSDGHDGWPFVLMSPLHPLKILFHLEFQRMMYNIVEDIVKQEGQKTLSFSSGDLNRVSHLDLPDLLTYFTQTKEGVYRSCGSAHSYWSVFVRADYSSYESALPLIKGKQERLLRTIVDPRDFSITTDIAASIRDRITQYLRAHFYILQRGCPLRLLFLNIGEATEVVDALVELDTFWKGSGEYPEIRFEILLVEIKDPLSKGSIDTGRSLRRFLAGTGPQSKGHDELISRISYSILEFPSPAVLMDRKDVYAHIAFVKRIFDIETSYLPSKTLSYPHSIRANGLSIESRTDYYGPENKYIIGTNAKCIGATESSETKEDQLKSLFWSYRNHQTRCLSGTTDKNQVLKLHLAVGYQVRKLIDWFHDKCNWLCLLDRHFTQEYFEKDLQADDKTILLNYTPKHERERGSHVLLTTTSHTELVLRTISQHFQTHVDIDVSPSQSRRLISIMNQLSGTWVLSSLTLSYSELRGNLGMGTAALWLLNGETCKTARSRERHRISEAKILVPLGDYIRPYWLERGGTSRKRSIRYCDDLLELYVCPHDQHIYLRGRIVEVKMRRSYIPTDACKQVRTTYQILSDRFSTRSNDPARVFTNRELAEMVDFFGRKMYRYDRWRDSNGRPVSQSECNEFISEVVDRIAKGEYSIDFTWEGKKGTVAGFTKDPDQVPECEDVELSAFGPEETKRILDGKLASPYKSCAVIESITVIEDEELLEKDTEQVDEILDKSIAEDRPPIKEDQVKRKPELATDPTFYLATESQPKEWGVIARRKGAHIALNLHEPMTVSLFGVPGSGKSYTAGVILEAAQRIPGELCKIASPLTCLIFHYSEQERYTPEFVTVTQGNQRTAEINSLKKNYGAQPDHIRRIKIAVPPLALKTRLKEHEENKSVDVIPIHFRPNELSSREWSLLMGVEGGQLYIRRIKQLISRLASNEDLTLDNLRDSISGDESLDKKLRDLASLRLDFVSDYVSDTETPITQKIYRGDIVIFDLRELTIDPRDAFVLFTILVRTLTDPAEGNVLILIDEAHKYFKDQTAESIIELVREMRHRGATLVVSSQDPPSIDSKIIENSSIIIAHKMTSQKWLKHLHHACGAFKKIKLEHLEDLKAGEAWVWASTASPDYFREEPRKVRIRPRATQHGGASRTN